MIPIALLIVLSLPPLAFGVLTFSAAESVYQEIVAALALAVWAILFSAAVVAGEVRDLRLHIKKNLPPLHGDR